MKLITDEDIAMYRAAKQNEDDRRAPAAVPPDEDNPYLNLRQKYEEEEKVRRAAPPDENNPYVKAVREFEEKEKARRAAPPDKNDPYYPYRHLSYKFEEDDEDEDDYETSGGTREPLGMQSSTSTSTVIDLPAVVVSSRIVGPTPKTSIKELYENPPYHIILGDCVIYVIRWRGEDLMFTKKAAYRYSNGLWSMETEGLSAWLNVEIEIAAKRYRQPSTIKLIAEARAWIQRQEQLFRNDDDIKWDAHGLVPTRSGLVNPRTGVIRPMQPDDYCTWRIEADYDPTAVCPWWLQMLDDVFADRAPKEQAATISVIQELLGAGLIDDKPRELSKALILLGGSNFGKSGVLEVMSGLFGQDFNSTPIEALERPHGTMGFLKRRPWVLHEAFDQRKWHFSSDVKTIITGEPIHINIKNGPVLSQRVNAPIYWGTNHPPQFKESTKAIANRLVVIECKREFFDDNPVGAAKEAFRLGLGKPSNLVLKQEMPGLLAWAMAGLKRALERGRLIMTKTMSDTIEEIRLDSNMVSGFLEECCHLDHDQMVSSPDFCLAFSSWWQAEKGETYSPPSNDTIGKALAAMAEPRIALGRELRHKHRRYYPGLVLNDEGLTYHRAGAGSSHLVAKTANITDPKDWVNKQIPETWRTKPEIIAMRKASGAPRDDTGKR